MAKVLVVYYSKTNNTKKMANFVEEGVKEEKIEVICKSLKNTNLSDLLEADGIIIGSPTCFGSMSTPIKEFIDKSINIMVSLMVRLVELLLLVVELEEEVKLLY